MRHKTERKIQETTAPNNTDLLVGKGSIKMLSLGT